VWHGFSVFLSLSSSPRLVRVTTISLVAFRDKRGVVIRYMRFLLSGRAWMASSDWAPLVEKDWLVCPSCSGVNRRLFLLAPMDVEL
jgi:hypothetical protein